MGLIVQTHHFSLGLTGTKVACCEIVLASSPLTVEASGAERGNKTWKLGRVTEAVHWLKQAEETYILRPYFSLLSGLLFRNCWVGIIQLLWKGSLSFSEVVKGLTLFSLLYFKVLKEQLMGGNPSEDKLFIAEIILKQAFLIRPVSLISAYKMYF